MTWKTRKELPRLKKIDIKFDIEKILEAYEEIKDNPWNAYDTDYKTLGDHYKGILKNSPYQAESKSLMSLTEYNPEYKIDKNRNSGSKWDKVYMNGKHELDARCYNKIKSGIPEYFSYMIQTFQPNVSRVMLTKLQPGEMLGKHIDHDTSIGVRYHIPIITNSDSRIGFIDDDGNDVLAHLPADGSVWFLNPGIVHWAENLGQEDRIHLIINMDTHRLINEC